MDQYTKGKTLRGLLLLPKLFIRRGTNNAGDSSWIVWERTGILETSVRGVWKTKKKAKWHKRRINIYRRLG